MWKIKLLTVDGSWWGEISVFPKGVAVGRSTAFPWIATYYEHMHIINWTQWDTYEDTNLWESQEVGGGLRRSWEMGGKLNMIKIHHSHAWNFQKMNESIVCFKKEFD